MNLLISRVLHINVNFHIKITASNLIDIMLFVSPEQFVKCRLDPLAQHSRNVDRRQTEETATL